MTSPNTAVTRVYKRVCSQQPTGSTLNATSIESVIFCVAQNVRPEAQEVIEQGKVDSATQDSLSQLAIAKLDSYPAIQAYNVAGQPITDAVVTFGQLQEPDYQDLFDKTRTQVITAIMTKVMKSSSV